MTERVKDILLRTAEHKFPGNEKRQQEWIRCNSKPKVIDTLGTITRYGGTAKKLTGKDVSSLIEGMK